MALSCAACARIEAVPFTPLTIIWTMTVSHRAFGCSCGGVPDSKRQIRIETSGRNHLDFPPVSCGHDFRRRCRRNCISLDDRSVEYRIHVSSCCPCFLGMSPSRVWAKSHGVPSSKYDTMIRQSIGRTLILMVVGKETTLNYDGLVLC